VAQHIHLGLLGLVWGSESKHFVRAVDWMERRRGFLPPLFVDLRLARLRIAADRGHDFSAS
jgi:hypothetical protein